MFKSSLKVKTAEPHSTLFIASFIKGPCIDSVATVTDTHQPSLIPYSVNITSLAVFIILCLRPEDKFQILKISLKTDIGSFTLQGYFCYIQIANFKINFYIHESILDIRRLGEVTDFFLFQVSVYKLYLSENILANEI